MPMQHAGNQEVLGDKLYFFRSPVANTAECLIWAHGTLLHGDGFYYLDAGLEVYYYVDHGENRLTSTEKAVQNKKGPRDKPLDRPLACSRGPKRMRNYTLWKFDGSQANGTYLDIEGYMQNNETFVRLGKSDWCPHVVTVRNRNQGLGKTIQMGDVITEVRGHEPRVKTFYYGCCRGDHTGKKLGSALARIVLDTGTVEAYTKVRQFFS